MAYNKFTYKNVGEKLGIKIKQDPSLFTNAGQRTPRPITVEWLRPDARYPLFSEMARRELIISAVLRELIFQSEGTVTVWSAEIFDIDTSLGLTGETDYLITRGEVFIPLEGPIIAVAEAKKNELLTGIGQCIAEMVAARIHNERNRHPVQRIYGVVTTGLLWGFMVLEGSEVKMNPREYTLDALEEILGILVYMSKTA